MEVTNTKQVNPLSELLEDIRQNNLGIIYNI
jgi:hypothetical protein